MALKEYISLSELNEYDSLLRNQFTQSDLDRANDEIEIVAKRNGAEPSEISDPINPYLKDFGLCFACYNKAGRLSGNNPKAYGNNQQLDPYLEKEKAYEKRMFRAETFLSYQVITGTEDSPDDFANPTIKLFRR